MKKSTSVAAVVASMASSALADVETVVRAWGLQSVGGTQVPSNLGLTASIAAGGPGAVAVTAQGSFRYWGWQWEVPPDLDQLLMARFGRPYQGDWPHAVVLERTGKVRCFGLNVNGVCEVPELLGPAVHVSTGGSHVAAVDRQGKVWAWGENNCGQVDVPSDLRDVVKAEAGQCHSLALRRDGTVRLWGWASQLPPDAHDITMIAGGNTFSMLVNSDGALIAAGGPAPPSDLRPLIDIAAGPDHVVAIQADGTVRSWGNSNWGQTSPPSDLSAAVQVAAGTGFQMALSCTRNTRLLSSSELAPFGFSTPRTWVAKGISAPRAGAVVRVTARGQLGTATRFLTVRADGVILGTIFGAGTGASTCASSPSVALLPISAAQFASMSSDGAIEIRIEPSINATSSGCETATLTVSLQYEGQIVDCDGNGVDDICQLESAPLVQDCNGNGILDACEPLGEETDCDGNGVFDSCDIARGAADEDNDGKPDECEYGYGDLNLDGRIDGIDLAALLAVWGAPNPPYGDLNGDGQVGGSDLAFLLARWGPVP